MRNMSLSFDSKLSPGETVSKASAHLKAVGYKTKHKTGDRIEAVDGRDHNVIATVLLIIFLFPIGLIYYFTRKKNRIIILAETGKCSLTYEGKKSYEEVQKLSSLLKS